MDRVGAAHEDAQGVVVEVLLGVELARTGEHERRVQEGKIEVKRRKPRSDEGAVKIVGELAPMRKRIGRETEICVASG